MVKGRGKARGRARRSARGLWGGTHPLALGSSWMTLTVRSFLVAGAMAVLVKAREAAPAGQAQSRAVNKLHGGTGGGGRHGRRAKGLEARAHPSPQPSASFMEPAAGLLGACWGLAGSLLEARRGAPVVVADSSVFWL